MANRNFPSNKLFQFHVMACMLNCKVTFGASGAVASFIGPGIASVTKIGTGAGTYRIQLQDNYSALYTVDAIFESPNSGTPVADGSFATGTIYQITAVGTTNWTAIGLPAGITPAIGQVFAATGAGGAGTGTASVMTQSGISNVEVLGGGTMLAPVPSSPLLGGFVTVQCLAPTNSSTTTRIPANPASGSVAEFKIYLGNSSVAG